MKIATVGKGGSGKTTIAGTLARILAGNGIQVLAIDGDPNPNLAITLGIDRDTSSAIRSIPSNVMAVRQEDDGTRKLYMTMSQSELLADYGTPAPDGIKLVTMGRPPDGSAGSGCMCASHRAVRGLITELSGSDEDTITDMEAGLEHLKRGTARNVDVMLIVAEPYYRSLEAAQRVWSLANELEIPHTFVISNKVKNDADRAAVEEFCNKYDMQVIGEVPFDEQLVEAERNAKAPFDFDPESAGVNSIREIAECLKTLKDPDEGPAPIGEQATPG